MGVTILAAYSAAMRSPSRAGLMRADLGRNEARRLDLARRALRLDVKQSHIQFPAQRVDGDEETTNADITASDHERHRWNSIQGTSNSHRNAFRDGTRNAQAGEAS